MIVTTHLKLEEYYTYKEFCNSASKTKYDDTLVLHRHHIIPRHMWCGDNLDIISNIVNLSVRDHCNAHILLARCYEEGTYENIANLKSARILDNKSVVLKTDMDILSNAMKGENNPFFGKTHTPETCDMLSTYAKNQQKHQPTYEDRYGLRAVDEKEKRKNGVTDSWKRLTVSERKQRGNNISKSLKGKMSGSKNGFAQAIMVNGNYFGSVAEAKIKLNVNRYYLFKNYIITKIKKK